MARRSARARRGTRPSASCRAPASAAWPAPRTPAVRSAISAISGVAGALRRTSGIELSPPGTVVVDDTTDCVDRRRAGGSRGRRDDRQAPDRRPSRTGRRRQHVDRADGVGIGHVQRRERRAARGDLERHRADVRRTGETGRVGGEPARHARRRDARIPWPSRRSRPRSSRASRSGTPRSRPRTRSSSRRRSVTRAEPRYVQTLRIVDSPPLPGGNESPAPIRPSRTAVPSTVRLEGPADRHAGRRARRRRLGRRQRPVAVEVEALARLERGDLGLVDDDVEHHPRRLDADPRVVVDREVAERVRQRDGRDDRHEHDARTRARSARGRAPHRIVARASRPRCRGHRVQRRPERERAAEVGRGLVGTPVGEGDEARVVPEPRVLGAGGERGLHRARAAPAASPALSSAQARVS